MSQYYIKFYNFTGQAIHPLCKRYAVILESRVQFLKFRLLIELLIRFYFNQFTTKAFSTFPLQYFSLSLNLYTQPQRMVPLYSNKFTLIVLIICYLLQLAVAASRSSYRTFFTFFGKLQMILHVQPAFWLASAWQTSGKLTSAWLQQQTQAFLISLTVTFRVSVDFLSFPY